MAHDVGLHATKGFVLQPIKKEVDPLVRNTRKRTSEVAALQHSVQDLSSPVDNLPDNRSEDDHGCGQYPDKTDRISNKNQPGLVHQY